MEERAIAGHVWAIMFARQGGGHMECTVSLFLAGPDLEICRIVCCPQAVRRPHVSNRAYRAPWTDKTLDWVNVNVLVSGLTTSLSMRMVAPVLAVAATSCSLVLRPAFDNLASAKTPVQ